MFVGKIMKFGLVRTYVYFLLFANIALVCLSVFLSAVALLYVERFYVRGVSVLWMGCFGLVLPVALLARERNVWRNEFADCPLWLRIITIVLLLYGFIGVALVTVLCTDCSSAWTYYFVMSTFPLCIEAVPLCILYSILFSRTVIDRELIRRVQIVAVVSCICLAFVGSRLPGYIRNHTP
jgi:hypothetical protein